MRRALAALGLAMAAGAACAQPGPQDDAAGIAARSGCNLCHELHPRNPENSLLPIGPAWTDIARRYRGRPDATARLTAVVLQGSGTGPGDRHWAGRSSGVVMPSNTLEISAGDAERVVRWILSLPR